MQTGIIPPNINFTKERQDIKAFKEGRIRVVNIATPWKPGFAGINSFGFGGANCHILLQSNLKQKVNGGAPNDDLPRLVIVSGRTEQAVELLLNEVYTQFLRFISLMKAYIYIILYYIIYIYIYCFIKMNT